MKNKTTQARTPREELEQRIFSTESSFWRSWTVNSAFFYKNSPHNESKKRKETLKKLNDLK